MRGATARDGRMPKGAGVSIHAPHARGDRALVVSLYDGLVSIHAPHARGDCGTCGVTGCLMVSIHAPHARGDS